jgi:hypothetical protein
VVVGREAKAGLGRRVGSGQLGLGCLALQLCHTELRSSQAEDLPEGEDC